MRRFVLLLFLASCDHGRSGGPLPTLPEPTGPVCVDPNCSTETDGAQDLSFVAVPVPTDPDAPDAGVSVSTDLAEPSLMVDMATDDGGESVPADMSEPPCVPDNNGRDVKRCNPPPRCSEEGMRHGKCLEAHDR
jgi:hypothetical protein